MISGGLELENSKITLCFYPGLLLLMPQYLSILQALINIYALHSHIFMSELTTIKEQIVPRHFELSYSYAMMASCWYSLLIQIYFFWQRLYAQTRNLTLVSIGHIKHNQSNASLSK